MKIYIGSDHAGFELKSALIPFVQNLGYEVIDCGPEKLDPKDDYPNYIIPLAEKVSEDLVNSRGIVIGSSGEGEAIAANKIPGIRAAEYYGGNLEIIKLSREHNNANILSLGAKFINIEDSKEALRLWLSTPFSGDERHVRRIKEIDELT